MKTVTQLNNARRLSKQNNLKTSLIDRSINQSIHCPRKQGFRLEGEIPRRYSSSSLVYKEKYLQLKYEVSIPEKISICLNRESAESLSSDDV